jgi:hypothetical protein
MAIAIRFENTISTNMPALMRSIASCACVGVCLSASPPAGVDFTQA